MACESRGEGCSAGSYPMELGGRLRTIFGWGCGCGVESQCESADAAWRRYELLSRSGPSNVAGEPVTARS